jgi:hypothetical protein
LRKNRQGAHAAAKNSEVAIMSEAYTINGHQYRAYPFHFYCDGIEISPAVFYAAVGALRGQQTH